MKRYAFDATRGEMFELASGAWVSVDDARAAVERLMAARLATAPDACVECALDVPLSKADTMTIWAELQLRADNPCEHDEAERRVLEAMGAIELGVLEAIRDKQSCAPPIFHPPCMAELARRGLEPAAAPDCRYLGRCNSSRCPACNPGAKP
jgi:hypothetical protein